MAFEEMLSDFQHVVISARSGEDALNQIHRHQPDVVITDFMMPLMNGMQLCMQLRDRADTRNIPLIMSSSVPTPAGADVQRRCDYFIAKPADFVLLLEVVHRTLGRTA